MMATAGPPSSSSLLTLLESLEDASAGQSEHTDAYLTIANRLSGEEGRQFVPAVGKHFSRLGKTILSHINSPNAELSQASLQALGFCVYHSHVLSGLPDAFAAEILSTLCSLVVKSTDKNTCTRALWVIAKQSLPTSVVAKNVPSILDTLESVWKREDIQSVVMEHEALNVVIRLLEQVPAQMGDGAVRWARLVIPLVVHSAPKVRLRAAAAMEMGMPRLLEKQTEVAAIIEPLMSTKLIPELQKLFTTKNETNVLKLWSLFVKLLGKLLHRGGPFINSLLHLEELGFRSSSPTVKKIAFIAWKSLIDNFALNPDILSSSKRMRLLLQPLITMNMKTEALLLTKVEVWWHLVVQLGPNLSANFDQVSVPLLQCASQTVTSTIASPGFNSPANSSRISMSLGSSSFIMCSFPSIKLLGLEMLLHYFHGPEVITMATKKNLILSLEPLKHPLLTGASSFTKHAAVLTSSIRDGFINIGKDAPERLLAVIWSSLVRFVSITIESGANKKERQGCEVLTLMLQALQSIATSEDLPADKVLSLFEGTVTGIPQRVLGSASYQVGKMDVLNGTPALFLILLLYNSSMLAAYVEDERFFSCLQMLVGCGLSGPTSPLAFGEAVLGAMGRSAGSVHNKEQLWRMWSVMVSQLTDTVSQSNEVNQGDALEHNFSAMHSALLFPVTHLLPGTALQQASQKSMLSTWSKLYKVFARCSALVVTAEENVCCEEVCAKMKATLATDQLREPTTLNAIASILQVMVECVDFSPYTPQFQQKLKSPHTPVNWMKKKSKVLGNLSTFLSLLVQCLEVHLESPDDSSEATGLALLSILSSLFTSLALAHAVTEALTALAPALTLFYKQAASETSTFTPHLLGKLEKVLAELLACLQTRSALAFSDELLALLSPLLCVLFPHKNKQLRNSVTQFWNSTFANSVSLTYPDEIRPILSQVKQKTPIILPGFEVVSVADELSGQYSSECSQLETKLSGMPVSSAGKRDSKLPKAAELKDATPKTSSPFSTKLDFGSPKHPRRALLEEEASIDFVFIPPEVKERVLTEHQKEVKRTKRVDIPAMYNNLDASLDTTVFTQYTQSQEDKVPTEQAETETTETPGKENGENDLASTKVVANPPGSPQKEEGTSESNDVSMESDTKGDDAVEEVEMQTRDSPNVSGTSDVVSGTPQKPNSRRQSFITLEKYAEGKPASPSSVSTFIGPHSKASSGQERSDASRSSSPQASQTSAALDPQDSQSTPVHSEHPVKNAPESPVRPKDSETKYGPVRLTERLPSNEREDEDVIPETQSETEGNDGVAAASESEGVKWSQDEDLEESQEDSQEESQSSQTPQDEPRCSGRGRGRPRLSGDDPGEKQLKKRRRSQVEFESDSPKPSSVQTRSKQVTENSGRLQTRAQSSLNQSNSQGRGHMTRRSLSQELPDKPTRKRSRVGESCPTDLSSDRQSNSDSQSQGRYRRRSRASLEAKEEETKKAGSPHTEGSRLTATGQAQRDHQSEDSQTTATSSPTPPEPEMLKETEQTKPAHPSQEVGTPQSELMEMSKNETDSQCGASFPANEESQDEMSTESSGPTEGRKVRIHADRKLAASQTDDLSSSESQTLRRSRRSKASETEENSQSKDSVRMQRRSSSQASLPAGSPAEATVGGRRRKSNVQEDQSKQSPTSTPESSQSQEVLGSTEAPRGRGKYIRKKSSQSSEASIEPSEPSQPTENPLGSKKRGRKPRASLQSPVTLAPQENRTDGAESDGDSSLKADSQSLRGTDAPHSKDAEQSQEEDSQEELEVQGDSIMEKADTEETNESVSVDEEAVVASTSTLEADLKSAQALEAEGGVMGESQQTLSVASYPEDMPPEEGAEQGRGSAPEPPEPQEQAPAQDAAGDSPGTEGLPEEEQSACNEEEQTVRTEEEQTVRTEEEQTVRTEEQQSVRTEEEQSVRTEEQQSVRTEEEQTVRTEEEQSVRTEEEQSVRTEEEQSVRTEEEQSVRTEEEQTVHTDEEQSGRTEEEQPARTEEEQPVCTIEEESVRSEAEQPARTQEAELPIQPSEACDEVVLPQESDAHLGARAAWCQGDAETQSLVMSADAALPEASSAPALPESSDRDGARPSPVKQKELEAVMASDMVQSPSSGRTRGNWSPSASPSTSILKKGQKRPLEEENLSPLVKSRRVSFANPIQQQETADDIDRRSPAVRTSSPRRSRLSGIPLPKSNTTPTKGLLVLSPRNLHSPGYKSSKKCLISEMGQEPRPVSRDCVYPALVGCSTPVEAVLPQISNMWSRGFGQLVRARNIKTVGDLSALTPSEIKTLPIRSPKISNVKKALRSYEQQRKGRGADELKSFDETEMMTSELEEPGTAQNQDEEDKASGEPLATELELEAVAADVKAEPSERQSGEAEGPAQAAGGPGGLLSQLEALSCMLRPPELEHCSPQQLLQVHEQLGEMSRRVVLELHTRLCRDDKP